MVSSAFRLSALAVLAAAAALLAFPAVRSGAQPARADAGRLELQPLGLPARERVTEPATANKILAPAPTPKQRGYSVARIRAGHTVKLRARPGGASVSSLGPRTEFGSSGSWPSPRFAVAGSASSSPSGRTASS